MQTEAEILAAEPVTPAPVATLDPRPTPAHTCEEHAVEGEDHEWACAICHRPL